MSGTDYYSVLGVGRDAGADDIKKAYRKLAQEYHPDKHKGDKDIEEKFKEINEAYEVLKDPAKKAQYDRFGYVGAHPGGGGGGYREAGFGADFQDLFGDVFSEFFGGGRRRPGPEPGVDLRYDIDITFEEAAFGTEKTVEIPRTAACKKCSGTGAKPGTSPENCTTCNGAGQVRFQQGFFSVSRTCPACSGKGVVIKDPCAECAGAGKVRVRRSITVKVPPGVDTGSRLRIVGEGESGDRGGPPGDLYVVLNVLLKGRRRRHLRGADNLPSGRARRGDRGAVHRGARKAQDTPRHAVRQGLQAQGQGDSVASHRQAR